MILDLATVYKGGVPKDDKWIAVAETKYARVLRYWCEI